ncbi:helix-turn-helix domain-containing protein, partial [Liquorilactobacillus sp.]|uniref:helix-turn-helix domain-containing protein n=1 Tax=Liquorilactobacillus sp. TaxID=2767923 RepID=UPI0039EAC8C7
MPRNKLSPLEAKIRKDISDKLKFYSRGMTQKELSEKTGIPVSTLSGYFARRSTPNIGAIEKLSEALNVNKSDIDPRLIKSVMPDNVI